METRNWGRVVDESAHPRPPRAPWWSIGVLVAAVGCLAFCGLSWNRTSAANVTVDDAIRVLQTSKNLTEREQAMATIARRCRELVCVLHADAEGADERLACYARLQLANIAKAANK